MKDEEIWVKVYASVIMTAWSRCRTEEDAFERAAKIADGAVDKFNERFQRGNNDS